MENLVNEPIVLIFGKICSGKSTYAQALSYITKSKRITVSDIVKALSGIQSRSGLQTTQHLDEAIAAELVRQIKANERVVIDGIRQFSIVQWILREFGAENILMIWLEVPDDIRKYRFYDRLLAKDDLTFEEADQRDEKLGLTELRSKLDKEYIQYTVINNH